jgi:hypothetical protein
MSDYLPDWHRVKQLKDKWRAKALRAGSRVQVRRSRALTLEPTPGPTGEGRVFMRRVRGTGHNRQDQVDVLVETPEGVEEGLANPADVRRVGKDLRPGGPWAHEPYGSGFIVRRQGEGWHAGFHRQAETARNHAAYFNRLHGDLTSRSLNPYHPEPAERGAAYDALLDQGVDEETARHISGWHGHPAGAKSLDAAACCDSCASEGTCDASPCGTLEQRYGLLRQMEEVLWNNKAIARSLKALGGQKALGEDREAEIDQKLSRVIGAQKRLMGWACGPQGACPDSPMCRL